MNLTLLPQQYYPVAERDQEKWPKKSSSKKLFRQRTTRIYHKQVPKSKLSVHHISVVDPDPYSVDQYVINLPPWSLLSIKIQRNLRKS